MNSDAGSENQVDEGIKRPSAAESRPATPTWQLSELLQGQREARILHEGEVYRLILTRNGKLILNK